METPVIEALSCSIWSHCNVIFKYDYCFLCSKEGFCKQNVASTPIEMRMLVKTQDNRGTINTTRDFWKNSIGWLVFEFERIALDD